MQANLHYLTWEWWGVLSRFADNGGKAVRCQFSDLAISTPLVVVASKGVECLTVALR